MTTPTNPIEPFSPFLPSTYNIPEEEDRRRTFLVDKFSNFADVINDKKIGIYLQAAETLNGNKWFYLTTDRTRNGYQALAYIPSLPNNTTLTLTIFTNPQYPIMDVNPQFVVSHVWGSASKPCSAVGAGDGDYFSYMAQGDSRISFTMSDTTIIITTTTDLSGYSGFIVIEYIRDGI
jgi:hypothetical protein